MTHSRSRWGFVLSIAGFIALGANTAARSQADVIISELMTLNINSVPDVDGDTPDWIELFNAGSVDADLEGWYLTDDPEDLPKWKFPRVTLSPGKTLLVFASDKNRTDPTKELHTNFGLLAEGEYLALVKPDGVTIAYQLTPTYPPQVQDVSYGVQLDFTSASLVPQGAAAQVLIPTGPELGLTWTSLDFDATAWFAAETGVGYDRKANPVLASLIKTNVETAMYRINPSAYLRIPFQVTDPTLFDALIFRMRGEDGFVAYLNGTEIARKRAPVPPTQLAWNSRAGAARPDADGPKAETFNVTSALSLLRAGTNVLAVHGLNDQSASPDFLVLPELEAVDVQGVQRGSAYYFPAPTPGYPGTGGLQGLSEAPELSAPPGNYTGTLELALSATPPGAVIRYTIDRSIPAETSPAYEGPITLTGTTLVRARTFEPGKVPSPVVSNVYIFIAPAIATFSSNLPIMIIDSFGRTISEDPPAHFPVIASIVEPGGDGRALITGPTSFVSRAGMEKRGSSSLGFPKNNYSFEAWGETDQQDKEVTIFGMPEEADWILTGPYTDKTNMRDYLAYDWSNKIGRYAVRGKFIEVYLNQGTSKTIANAQYWGIYVFMEKIKRGDERVAIQQLHASETSEPEITGGYILKKDRLDPGDAGLVTSRGTGPLGYVYPKEKVATTAQKNYLRNYLNQYEAALYGASFKDPENGYAKYIDVDTFIDHHIIVELTKNIDGYRLSTFLFKDREGKINMGPVWDYNLCLGNADYLNGWLSDGWYYTQLSQGDYPWYPRLFQDPAFVARYRERWMAHRLAHFQTEALLTQIDQIAAFLDEAQVRNFKRWPILGQDIWPNWYVGRTYQDEINFMKDWLAKRLDWIDGTFVTAPTFSPGGGFVEPGAQLTITAAAGDILYTLSGPDPKGTDGSPAPEAQVYTQPITITDNVLVRARARVGGLWSGMKEAIYVAKPLPLVITEIMYNPLPPPQGSTYRAADFEFIELQNIGAEAFDLQGVRMEKGVAFQFPLDSSSLLGPGEHLLVVKNPTAFATRYDPAGLRIAGQYTGDLSDTRDNLVLKGPLGEPIIDFSYLDSWHPATDGQGYSLVVLNPSAPRDTWGKPESWRPSGEVNGSPGKVDTVPPGGWQRPGDFSQDGKLNLTDAIGILRHLFQGLEATLPCDGATANDGGNLSLLDVDSDGSVSLTDAVNILRYLYQGGTPPALGTGCVRLEGCPQACVE